MTASTNAGRVEIKEMFDHPPEKVFDAWTDAEGMRQWMRPGPTKDALTNLDVRVGGKYTIEMLFDEGSIKHWGEYTTVERPSKLEFTWNADHFNEPTTVSLTFKKAGNGCELVLVHEGLPDEESVSNHTGGWGGILSKLKETLDA